MGRVQESEQRSKEGGTRSKGGETDKIWEVVAQDFLGNRRNFWKKVKVKKAMHKWNLGIESEDGTLLTEQREVRNRWKDYFRGLLDREVRDVDTRRGWAERDRSMADEITEDEIRRAIWKL